MHLPSFQHIHQVLKIPNPRKMADSSSESLEIDWNSDDEREIGTASAINQDPRMGDLNKEILNIDWTTDDEQEIENASPVHQDPFVDARMDDSSKKILNIDWTTQDELEIETTPIVHQAHPVDCGSSSSSAALPGSKAIDEFLNMGFPVNMIEKAFKANGLNDKEVVLDALLTYNLIENSPDDDFEVDVVSSDEEQDCVVFETKGASDFDMKKDCIVSTLVEMGYATDFASNAIDRCGIDAPFIDLIEIMDAASMVQDCETSVGENFRIKDHAHEKKERGYASNQKRKQHIAKEWAVKRHRVISEGRKLKKQPRIHDDDDDQRLHLPSPMIGFGLPYHHPSITDRKIPVEAAGAPYFYYENVALTPMGVWQKISRFLYGILPEFVDSKYLSAACRKRGYIHNLPIKGRFLASPTPPQTIAEALPYTKEHWPSWDPRTQLNCILSCTASAPLTDKVKARVDKPGGPSAADKKYVLEQCRKWNMVWVGKHKVASLNPDEIELIMGFPLNHTRGGGISHCDRLTVLASSFQVDTVAYHLSVLKDMFPDGINVLSLFSGIGGAEVALHRLGIRLKNVVSVEISEASKQILQDWWDQTDQRGKLVHFHDVQLVSTDHLEMWISQFGGFDLIIGGSPCNNIAGINRSTRTGLEGEHSSLFYEYNRIVHTVRELMRGRDGVF